MVLSKRSRYALTFASGVILGVILTLGNDARKHASDVIVMKRYAFADPFGKGRAYEFIHLGSGERELCEIIAKTLNAAKISARANGDPSNDWGIADYAFNCEGGAGADE